jgi:hypothetical protein
VKIAYWIILALTACPLPLTVLAWRECMSSSHPARIRPVILLSIATISYVWLLLGMKFPASMGDYYSNPRYAIIDGNFVVMIGCSIGTFLSKAGQKTMLFVGLTCLLLTLLWSIVGALNVVV